MSESNCRSYGDENVDSIGEEFDLELPAASVAWPRSYDDPQVELLLAHRKDIFTDYFKRGIEDAFGECFRVVRSEALDDSPRVLYHMERTIPVQGLLFFSNLPIFGRLKSELLSTTSIATYRYCEEKCSISN
jgi:hypothetical protein